MLPPLHRLVPTGEFYALPRREATQLNDASGGDPMTGLPFPANCHRDARRCKPTFRVWAKDEATGNRGAAHYSVYFARFLWDWYQYQPTDPNNRQLCWKEDWWALRAKYDATGSVPGYVEFLPSYNRVQELVDEKQRCLAKLAQASDIENLMSSTHMHGLANLLGNRELLPDGSSGPEPTGWHGKLSWERALRWGRWLMEAGVLETIEAVLANPRTNTSELRWAVELIVALSRALGERPDSEIGRAESERMIQRLTTMPVFLKGLVDYGRRVHAAHANSQYESASETVPMFAMLLITRVTLRGVHATRSESAPVAREAFERLVGAGAIDLIAEVIRPLPTHDSADDFWGYMHRATSKLAALNVFSFITMGASPNTLAQLARRDLLLSLVKFATVSAEDNLSLHQSLSRFQGVVRIALLRIASVSPDANAVLDELFAWFGGSLRGQ
jgi:hypothetical protein